MYKVFCKKIPILMATRQTNTSTIGCSPCRQPPAGRDLRLPRPSLERSWTVWRWALRRAQVCGHTTQDYTALAAHAVKVRKDVNRIGKYAQQHAGHIVTTRTGPTLVLVQNGRRSYRHPGTDYTPAFIPSCKLQRLVQPQEEMGALMSERSTLLSDGPTFYGTDTVFPHISRCSCETLYL